MRPRRVHRYLCPCCTGRQYLVRTYSDTLFDIQSLRVDRSNGVPTIKMEQITTLTVSNMDDPEGEQRQYGITVMADWWAQANNISKQMLWRGLIASAEEAWANQDRLAAEAAEAARLAAEEQARLAVADAAEPYVNQGDDTVNGSWAEPAKVEGK